MKRTVVFAVLFYINTCYCCVLYAQNIYELHKFTEDQWLKMSTEQRLDALGTSLSHARNQTFVGNFGTNYDKYKRWGYDFYEMNDQYENLAFRGFENYNLIEERRRRWSYNEFGDRIARMRHSGRVWNETYLGDGTFYVDPPYNYINAISTYKVDGVWLAQESTEDWNISVIGAGAIRKKFTPLTLSLPNIEGMAIEFESPNTKISIINSSLLGSHSNVLNQRTDESDIYRFGGLLLRGGTIRRKIGTLTLGSTYVNNYSVQGNREDGDNWFGTVNNYTPTPIYAALRFLDDSPNDNEGGPVIYKVRLKVNGRYRDDVIPTAIRDDVRRDRLTAVTSSLYNLYLTPPHESHKWGPSIDHLSTENIPKYGDYLYLLDFIEGNNLKNVNDHINIQKAQEYYELIDSSQMPIHVNGHDSVVFLFDLGSITETVRSIEVEVTVANDYRIQTSNIFTKEISGGHDSSGSVIKHYRSLYWTTMAQSDGNIKDGSNIRTISIDYGFQVASVIYGFDADFDYHGLKISGEYVINSSHYMFPDGKPGTGNPENVVSGQAPREGDRWTLRDTAYYITAQKNFKKFGFSAEIFKMGKFYRPYIDYYTSTVQKRMEVRSAGQTAPRNHTLRIPFISDNDDDDQYHDTDWKMRSMGYQLQAYEDPDGVFPGNDLDNDGLPDNNKNNNMIPDYSEPFLMFDSDPDEFVFGDDFNNNTIPDFREDDMKFDTPYDLDRKGYHANLRYSILQNLHTSIGRMETTGVGLDNRTYNDYFKMHLNYNIFSVGVVSAEYRYERIQDNIADPYLRVELSQRDWYSEINMSKQRFQRAMYYDMLDYKNSKVQKLYIDSKIRAIPSVAMENLVKYEVNDQIEGTLYDKTYQRKDSITSISMINKIVYTKRWNDFVFSPGIKFRFYKRDLNSSINPYDHYLLRIPLVTFKYIIAPNTDIMFGIEGFKGFELRAKNYVQPQYNMKRQTYLLQLQNRTTYFGYNVWASTGFKIDEVNYDSDIRAFEEYKTSTIFVKINIGWL